MSQLPNFTQHPPGLAGPSNAGEDLTWLDFLRAAGGNINHPPQPERRTSADRKRRYTGAEPEGRSCPYPHHASMAISGRRAQQETSGLERSYEGFHATPRRIPQTPLIPSPTSPHVHSSGGSVRGVQAGRQSSDENVRRSEGEIVVPPWQPDGDVTRCPVCQSEFSFWYRKHHCRKCGRVVCNACSPHRITIPRQFIVHPPNPYVDEQDLAAGYGDGEYEYLGGGEVVRVCNPCVPDPWTPTAADASAVRSPSDTANAGLDSREGTPPELRQDYLRRLREDALRRSQPSSFVPPAPPPFHLRHRSQTYQPTTHPQNPREDAAAAAGGDNLSRLMTAHLTNQLRHHRRPPLPTHDSGPLFSAFVPNSATVHPRRHTHTASTTGPNRVQNPLQRQQQQRPPHRIPQPPSILLNSRVPYPPNLSQSQPSSSSLPRPRIQFVDENPSSSRPAVHPPPPTAPRRVVKEEDECPVCGIELPPGETIREAHVQECIATRFASAGGTTTTGGAPPASTVPHDPTTTTTATTTTADPAARSGEGPASHGRPRATSYRPRGMAVSHATEKDCVAADGAPVECVICFDEFQPGDELGRMECLCKFHRACIRRWWETKGVGSCPTHQLHE